MTIIRHRATISGFAIVATSWCNVDGFTARFQAYTVIDGRTFLDASDPYDTEAGAIAVFNAYFTKGL